MGYEITFSYHEKGEDGKFDMDTTKTFTKKLGTKTDDVPLEKVAATILGQLAKRSIYISNVKVEEFVRREVSFKETDSGIMIKGRKFHFDKLDGELDLACSAEECPSFQPQQRQQNFEQISAPVSDAIEKPLIDMATGKMIEPMPSMPQNLGPKVPPRDPNVPIRHEVFRPCREDYMETQRQGIKLSMGKTYPIFSEKIRPINGPYGPVETVFYTVKDDNGQKLDVINTYFEPVPRGLSFTGIQTPVSNVPQGRLLYADAPLATGGYMGVNADDRLAQQIAAQDAALARRG